MSLPTLISSERDRYVAFFAKAKEQYLKERPQSATELLISLNTEELQYPYRYLRVDLMHKDSSGQPQAAELRMPPEKIEPKGFNFGAFIVEVYPFSWCATEVLLGSAPTNMKQLEGWMTRWLDVQDKNPPSPEGLSQAAHSFSPVRKAGEWWSLVADFGTAPADALLQLIELLASQGVKRFVLKSAA